jgi:glycosyltransferase involved in cell wall biosynthesis
MPPVDIVIPTIGRGTLEQAVLAALAQTYAESRVVVIADGPRPEARAMFERQTSGRPGAAIYRETPARFGFGDAVTQWWVDGDECGEWVKVLDDDDWMPQCAVGELMRCAEADAEVVLVTAQMVMIASEAGRIVRTRIVEGDLAPAQIGNGNCMFKRDAAKGLPAAFVMNGDWKRMSAIAAKGKVAKLPYPLYFYIAWRRARDRADVAAKLGPPWGLLN